MNPKVDFYFKKAQKWQREIELLREIVLETGLTEELKWGVPTYLYQKNNIVLIHVFKEYVALLFFKGVLLNNDAGFLIQQTKNVQSARQMRFSSVQNIAEMKTPIRNYIYEAIEVENAELKVQLKEPSEFKIAEEFQNELDRSLILKTAFEKLTQGRQKPIYCIFVHLSNQRLARIELETVFLIF